MDSVLGRDSILLRSRAELTWKENGEEKRLVLVFCPSLCTSIPVVSSFQRKLLAKGKSSLQSASSQGIDSSKPHPPIPVLMLSTCYSTEFPMTA